MKGVNFIISPEGKKKAMVIDLENLKDLSPEEKEEIEDLLGVYFWENEPTDTLENVEKRLTEEGLLDRS